MRSIVALGFTIMLLIGVWGLQGENRVFRIGIILTLLQLIFSVSFHFTRYHILEISSQLVVFTFCILSVYMSGRNVFSLKRTDRNIMAGALCIYLLIGLIWALLYAIFALFVPHDSFQGIELANGQLRFDDLLYFSYTTLTTAGYGDITPINPIIRAIAYFEMLTGQFYLAIMVAGLVSQHMMNRTHSS
jgi:hypothetical protein